MPSLRFSISHGVVKCSSVSCRPQIMVSRPSTTTNAAAVRTCKMKHIQQQRLVQMRSTDVSNPTGAPEGQMSQEIITAMEAKIADALEAQQVSVTDVYGDGRHVNISVVSAAFEGKNSVQRQRMVYKAIWLELQDAVHAVDSMTTKTPAEAA